MRPIPPTIASEHICDGCGNTTYTLYVEAPLVSAGWCKVCLDKAFYLKSRSDMLKRSDSVDDGESFS